ncbi:hypothetical protein [Vibrio kanaloae]|uniref:hypothetical protein n=1 Tax=Vibrio kanaloae TaxID=170673 RepID=UPI001EFCE5D2|nr:hypothetical protein [Vibrio kanaloae]MCG9557643.1 hypothetical protein [Vibrio kanaloae]
MEPSKIKHPTFSIPQVIAIAFLGFALSGCDNGSEFNTKQLIPDDVSKVEALGIDLLLYEFTPRTSPNKQCLFVEGHKKGGLTCFDKEVRL